MTMKKCTGCGRYDTEPLGNNKYGIPFIACCPDNDYREVTAVEWLYKQLELCGDTEGCKISWEEMNLLVEQAKEMEKQQIIDAYKGEASRHPVIQEMFEKQAEQYYTLTYAL